MNDPSIGSVGGSRTQALVSDLQRNSAASRVKESEESKEENERSASEEAASQGEGPTGSLDVSA
jgi:hypothetical protein